MKELRIAILVYCLAYLIFILQPYWPMDIMGMYEHLFLGYMIRVQSPFLLIFYWSVTIIFFIIVFLIPDKHTNRQSIFIKILFPILLGLNIFLTISFSQKVQYQMNDFKKLIKEMESYYDINNEYPTDVNAICKNLNLSEEKVVRYSRFGNNKYFELWYEPFGFNWNHLEYHSNTKKIIIND
jgi:hypothetical protein